MPDVSSTAPADVNQWIVFDVHKNSLVAGVLPASGGTPQVSRLENTERAIRRFIDRAGETSTLAVAYEARPCGYDLFRLLARIGVACDVIAPSLVPIRAGDSNKTDRRDAKKLVRLYRAGELSFVAPPSPAQEGLRDLVRCRDDLRCARTAARHRVAKALLRHGRIFRAGKKAWTKLHRAWVAGQRLEDPLAQLALEQMLNPPRRHRAPARRAGCPARAGRPRRALGRPGRGPGSLPWDLHAHRARADRRGRRLSPLLPPA